MDCKDSTYKIPHNELNLANSKNYNTLYFGYLSTFLCREIENTINKYLYIVFTITCMPISSNSLIHFTESENIVRKIIEEGFRIKYCLEQIYTPPTGSLRPVVPMVSFCDIPLSQIKDHIDKYGNYGIGLSKEWAIKQGLNPVLYLDKNSSLAENFRLAMRHQVASAGGQSLKDIDVSLLQLFDVFRYIKNYDSDLTRKGVKIENYRFYDEREWRYVPKIKEIDHMFLSLNNYNTLEKKDAHNKLIENIRLKFELSDINYIILKSDTEIIKFVNWLRSNHSEKATDAEIMKLTSRIITVDRIKNDF